MRTPFDRSLSDMTPIARRAPLLAALLSGLLLAPTARALGADSWVTTWAATPARGGDGFGPAVDLNDQTVRLVVHVSAGGSAVRIRLSSEFGTRPVKIGAASIGLSNGEGRIKPSSAHPITFNGGATQVNLVPGAPLLSDPLPIAVAAQSDLVVDLYLPGNVPHDLQTWHAEGHQTTYVTSGNHVGATKFDGNRKVQPRFFLTGVEVQAPASPYAQTIVAIGDSITDGSGEGPDANQRWPDFLARRLQGVGGLALEGVANEGFGGNHLLEPGSAPPVVARFDRDVLAHPNVRYVVVLIGANDLGGIAFGTNPDLSADDLIHGYQQLIGRAHSRGLRIYGATITPFYGSLYYSPKTEAVRAATNDWIRTSGAYDAVIDFDAVVRDPANPLQILPAWSADDLHMNAAGYQAMGNSIDLGLFAHPVD